MSTLIESEAQFSQRLNDLLASDDLKRALRNANLKTYRSMAYSHGQPGQPIADDLFEAWVTANLLQAPSVADFSAAKRILFESQTLVLASFKESLNVPEPTSVKRVPQQKEKPRC